MATLAHGAPSAPAVDVPSVALAETTLANGARAATTPDATHDVVVTGPPGTTARVVTLLGALYLPPDATYDVDAYEANAVESWAEATATLGADGTATLPVTLTRASDDEDLTLVLAVLSADGVDGPAAAPVVLEYDPDGDALAYAWALGDGTTTTAESITHEYAATGTYDAVVTVTDPDGASDTATASVTVEPAPDPEPEPEPTPGEVVFATNAGGGTYTAADGTAYEADTGFSGGRTYAVSSTTAVDGTVDDALYRTERYGDFTYSTALPDGTYLVTLRFAEVYWTGSGERVFDATVEGEAVVTGLDLYTTAGSLTAYDVTTEVTVTDGSLDASFTTDVDNAKLSALVVETADGTGTA